MATRRSPGFTLVELLVVITIIGMLAALILPALGAARERGRQTKCQNNLRELARAVRMYVETKKVGYPPSFGSPRLVNANNTPDASGNGPDETWPWAVYLLQVLDEENLYKAIEKRSTSNGDGLTQAAFVEMFVCPSDLKEQSVPSLSYGANMGIPDLQDPPFDSRANGIFHRRKKFRNGRYRTQVVQVKDDDIKDGKNSTLLFVENVNVHLWTDVAGEYSSGVVWFPGTPPPFPNPFINEDLDLGPQSDYSSALPNSRHPGIFSVAYAGGNVALLSEEIDPNVYYRLMTPRGAESGDGNPHPYQSNRVTNSELNP